MNKIALSAKDLSKIYKKDGASINSTLALNKLNLSVFMAKSCAISGSSLNISGLIFENIS